MSIAGVANYSKENAAGIMISGGANLVFQSFGGLQVSGGWNWADSLSGPVIQLTGGLNSIPHVLSSGGNGFSFQSAGIANVFNAPGPVFQVAGLVNAAETDRFIVQISGLVGYVKSSGTVVQIAGGVNTGGSRNMLQLSLLTNLSNPFHFKMNSRFRYAENPPRGLQVTGGVNAVTRGFSGVAFSGISNYSDLGIFKGVQLTGGANISDDYWTNGVQLGGLVNLAFQMRGIQIAGL